MAVTLADLTKAIPVLLWKMLEEVRQMKLPIDVVPNNAAPPQLRFRWAQVVEDWEGSKRHVPQEGALAPGVDLAVAELIGMVKQLQVECTALRRDVVYLNEQLAEVRNLREPPKPAPNAANHPKPKRQGGNA